MPKPAGTCGSTKMRILAIICHNSENGRQTYGYDIWKTMKQRFHTYMNDSDVGNVYHHLTDLYTLNFISRVDESPDGRCYYRITDEGLALRGRYRNFIDILEREKELN